MSDDAKRQPTKPVKAWAIVTEAGELATQTFHSRENARLFAMKDRGERVVRVEIREVPR